MDRRANSEARGADEDWRRQAECDEDTAELFFPVGEKSALSQEQIKLAKEICSRCEVIDQCLDFATRNEEKYGVWGGTTPAERERVARRLRQTARQVGNRAVS